MNKSILLVITACALAGAVSVAQDPGFIQKLDPQKHREVMPIHVRLQEEQRKQDAELEPLLATMNSATGEKRVDALIAVVNKLVEQRKAMQEKLAGSIGR